MATPYRISIGVDIDASGAKRGSAETRQQVSAIAAEAEKATPKIEAVANAVQTLDGAATSGAAVASIDAIRASAVGAIPSMERLVNTFAGITAPGANDNGRVATLAAYAAELDRIQAKFDPVFAAQQRYEQNLSQINELERVGQITASAAIEMRLREANAYDGLISKVERLGAARKAAAQEVVDRQTITPDRAADVEAYGRSLDQLRARYNPLYATVVQYKQAQLEIRNAHAVGAISADEMTEALSRQRQATLRSIDAIKGRNKVIAEAPTAYGARGFETANIAAQFQDIGVTAAMGMSPLQIALQQGTQLSAILSTMDKPVMGLAAAFSAVLSPLSLVTIGTVAAGAAAVQYFSGASSGGENLDAILARNKASLDGLGPAYARATAARKEYFAIDPDIVNADLKKSMEEAAAVLAAASKGSINDIRAAIAADEVALLGTAAPGTLPVTQYEGAKRAIDDYAASVEAGTPKIQAFQKEILRLAETGQISEATANQLRELTNAALEADAKVFGTKGKTEPVALAFRDLQEAIDDINPYGATGRLGEMSGELDTLWRNMRAGRVDTTDLTRELDRLRTINPDMSGVIDEIERLGRVALATMANVQSLANVGTLGKSGRNQLMERNDQRDQDRDFFLRTDDDLSKKLKAQADELERAAQKTSRAGASARNAYRDLIKSADDRIAQMKLEAEMAGKVGIEADALRFKLDLLQRSEDKGRSISEKQRAEIEKKVEAFKAYAEAAATAKLRADLLWESDQAGRAWMDQQIAGRLRSSGLDIDFDSAEADLIRMNLALEASKSYAADFTDTLFDGLGKGEDLFDSLADAGIAAFKRLGKSLWEDVLNMLFSAQSGGGSGLLGGILSFFGGGSAAADPWSGLRSASTSVATAGLGVSANSAVRSATVQPMLPASRSVDQVAQASAAAMSRLKIELGLSSDAGLNIRPQVVGVVQETAPDIAIELIEQNNEGEAARVAQHTRKPRWS